MLNRALSSLCACVRLDHPIWLCAFRSFFALTSLSAVALLALWLLFWLLGWPLPAVPGGALVWHAHELLLGFALAAVAGFSLTAVPEFTATAAFSAHQVRRLVALWLLARIAFWLSGWWGIPALAVSAVAHLALVLGLAWLLAPRLWRDPERKHLAFMWAMLALAVTVAGFYVDALQTAYPMRWLHAMLGVLMILIVVAMSRISMRIVNASIEETEGTRHSDVKPNEYLARPPRRNLAIFCIGAFTLAQWWQPHGRIAGWLALAAAASLLNLLNDWHVGRALLRRWPLMLYSVYALMAAGYGVIGMALIADGNYANAGLHLLTAGALGLNIFAVICIAGYTHSGLEKDGRTWVPVGAGLLIFGALLRALAQWTHHSVLVGVSGAFWCMAFGLLAWQMLPVFLSPRRDGAQGCDGIPTVSHGAKDPEELIHVQ